MSEQAQTEQLIKKTAKKVFFQKGFLDATTQEIADEAGVNRALIHYYFRSREQLLDTLIEESVREKKEKMRAILTSSLTFREKIAQYIDVMIDRGIEYPYMENFLITEMARKPEQMKVLCAIDKIKSSDLIKKELEEEIANGSVAPVTSQHFMINLSSMCAYPVIAKPIFQMVHGMSDSDYKKFLLERKQVIYTSIFNEPLPKKKLTQIV
ncbi:MAG TPA: TetR/AcrR family transcriptional regulator [Cyclobacteriaceae bacterium]